MSAVERVKELVHEGNIRRVVVSHDARTVAQFPLTAGVAVAVVAPMVAVLGGIAALVTRSTVAIERTDPPQVESGTVDEFGLPE